MPVDICLIGAGRIGRIHADNVARHAGARLRYVVDADAAAARELAARYGAASAALADALADDGVDGAIVASPTDTHWSIIEACVQARWPVLCEKPLDLDVARAERSAELAAAAGVALFVGFNRRFDPSFRRLHDEVRAGSIGAVEMVTITSRDPAPPPHDYLRRSGGLFRDMTIHDLDMARWLLGAEPVYVYAAASCLVDPVIGAADDVDTAVLVLETGDGRLCQISNSRRCSYGYDQRVEVSGASGRLQVGNRTATGVVRADAHGVHGEPALPFFLERYQDAYRLELDEFIAALAGAPSVLATAADGVRALRLAEAAERSRRERQPVLLA